MQGRRCGTLCICSEGVALKQLAWVCDWSLKQHGFCSRGRSATSCGFSALEKMMGLFRGGESDRSSCPAAERWKTRPIPCRNLNIWLRLFHFLFWAVLERGGGSVGPLAHSQHFQHYCLLRHLLVVTDLFGFPENWLVTVQMKLLRWYRAHIMQLRKPERAAEARASRCGVCTSLQEDGVIHLWEKAPVSCVKQGNSECVLTHYRGNSQELASTPCLSLLGLHSTCASFIPFSKLDWWSQVLFFHPIMLSLLLLLQLLSLNHQTRTCA